MKIDLVAEGLLDRRRFNVWQADTHKAIHAAVARAMRDSGKDMAAQVRGEMRTSFRAASPKFLRSMHAGGMLAASAIPRRWRRDAVQAPA